MLSRIRKPVSLAAVITMICIALVATVIITVNNIRLKGVLRDETITIELTRSAHPQQLTFDYGTVLVKVGCDQYLTYLDIKIKDGLLSRIERFLYERFKTTFEEANSCELEHLPLTLDKHDIANILEQGIASVYDKRNQAYVATVSIRYYNYICGGWCSGKMRYFYLPDGTMFFIITDLIS